MGTLIWLASYPKSGNTWTRSFLQNLLVNGQEPADINALDRFCRGGSSRKWFEMVASAPLEEMPPEALARLRPGAQLKMSETSSDSVFVKSHNYLGPWFGVPLHNLSITAAALYILRNPLDVSLSLAHHYGETVDWAIDFMSMQGAGTKLTDKRVPEVYDTWSAHVASWTAKPNSRLFVVRYEDILDDPLKYFAEMAAFLGMPPDKERVERAVRHSSFTVLKSQENVNGFAEKPENAKTFFREGRAGQWREVLTPDQVRRIISDHRVQMDRFDYIPDDYKDV